MSYFMLPIQLLKFKCSLKRMDNLSRGRESFFSAIDYTCFCVFLLGYAAVFDCCTKKGLPYNYFVISKYIL